MRDARYQFLDRIWTNRKPADVEEIKEWQEKREQDLEILSATIEALQKQLPALCERLPADELCTRLSHHHLSLCNVLADENGMPITLLNWESSELLPLIFLGDLPRFLEGGEFSYEPQPHIMPSWAKLRYSAEQIQKPEAVNKEVYLERLDTYTTQKLRSEYQAELQRLGFSLQDVNWEHIGEKVWELYYHIIFIWQETLDIVSWVETQFKSDSEDESEEEEEGSEYDEDEEGEVKEYDENVEGKAKDMMEKGVGE